MVKFLYFIASVISVFATGMVLILAAGLVLLELSWGPYGQDPQIRFVTLAMCGLFYLLTIWFGQMLMNWSVRSNTRKRSIRNYSVTESSSFTLGAIVYGITGFGFWIGGAYFSVIDTTDLFNGGVLLFFGIAALTMASYCLTRTTTN